MSADNNMTLYIDPTDRDLQIDNSGIMQTITGDDTAAQCVRLTLQTWLAEFDLDATHGTEYDRILGKRPHELAADEVGEVLRAAILQEPCVAQVDSTSAETAAKTVTATFGATLSSGRKISMEVTA